MNRPMMRYLCLVGSFMALLLLWPTVRSPLSMQHADADSPGNAQLLAQLDTLTQQYQQLRRQLQDVEATAETTNRRLGRLEQQQMQPARQLELLGRHLGNALSEYHVAFKIDYLGHPVTYCVWEVVNAEVKEETPLWYAVLTRGRVHQLFRILPAGENLHVIEPIYLPGQRVGLLPHSSTLALAPVRLPASDRFALTPEMFEDRVRYRIRPLESNVTNRVVEFQGYDLERRELNEKKRLVQVQPEDFRLYLQQFLLLPHRKVEIDHLLSLDPVN